MALMLFSGGVAFSAPATSIVHSVHGRAGVPCMMPASKGPFKLPEAPANFDGAQWAPTSFLPFPITINVEPAAKAVKKVLEEEVKAPAAPPAAAAEEPPAAAPADPNKSTYTVTLNSPDGGALGSFECPKDMYILDAIDELDDAPEGFADLPYACRAGSCSACAGKMVSGSVDASDCAFLSPDQIGSGFVLTCTARPTSDCVITTHVEDDLY